MRAPSGTLHVIDFKTDQIVANIQPQDYWDDIRHWEIKNNIDTLEFKVFDHTEHAATLMQQNLVLKEVRDGRIVPYVINNEVEKDSRDRSLTVHASGAWVQIAKDGYIMPQRIEGKTVNQFMDMALVGMKWKRGKTEYAGFHTMTIDIIIDPLTFLKKIASLFELEIQYRVEVVGSQIVNWYVDMVKKRGRDTGKEVTLGKDLVGVRRIEHSRDVCTALVGFVQGEGDTIITVESINDGLPYITDSDAYQRWNENGKHKFGFYTPETEEQNMTPKRLLTLMKTEFAKRVNSSVSYEVNAQSIGRVFGLAHELINEGDTIRIKDTGFTPKLYLEARAIAGDESHTDPSQDKYAFGDYREITDPNEELRKIYNRILSKFGEKQEMLDQLDEVVRKNEQIVSEVKQESAAAKTLAEMVQKNLQNYQTEIIKAKNAPTTGLEANKTLWLDISKTPYLLYLWSGTVWRKMGIDTPAEIGAITKVELEKSTESIKQSVEKVERKQTEQGEQLQQAQARWETTANALEGKVEIQQMEDYVGGFQIPELKNTVTKNKHDVLDEISKKVATESYNTKVTELERLISANAKGISLAAVKTEVYTRTESDGRYADKAYVERQAARIDVTEKVITSTVQKGDIISAINQTAEKITIDVSKIAINADTMVKWLTAKGIDTNVINVNGDKITIDKNGVTVKMLDFLFEDEWGTKTTVMPKRNLIADHDFSSVPKMNIGNPNYQGFGTGYGLPWKVQGNSVAIENNTFIFNYEQMVNAVRVDTYNYPETKVQNGIHPGNSYTLSAHYRTAQINGVRTTAKPRLQVCFVTPLDEVSYKIWHEIYKDFPEPSTFYGEMRRYHFTFTVPNNYNPQEHMIVVKVTAANAQVSAGRAVCVSGITLVSGNYACMYNWDRAAAERADGLQPFNKIAIGGVNNNIGPADHGQTFDISTEKDVFIHQPILTQGINLGRNKMGQAGSIRFFDGGQGYGFYFMGMGGQWYKLPNV